VFSCKSVPPLGSLQPKEPTPPRGALYGVQRDWGGTSNDKKRTEYAIKPVGDRQKQFCEFFESELAEALRGL
jgi:hypothetical protein